MRNKRKGFTLAEVLITLTIIGAVAALSIPSLVNNVNNTMNVVQLKKTFSDLQQAFMLLQAENAGSIVPTFQNDIAGATGGVNVMNAFLTKMNYVKNCGSTKGCWYDSPVYYLNGSTYSLAVDTTYSGKYGKAILVNGTTIMINVLSVNCTLTAHSGAATGQLNNNVCASIYLDINGAKGPNKFGRDFFLFWITKTGIYPWGLFNDGQYCNVSPGDDPNSAGCAAKVLSEGAMNY